MDAPTIPPHVQRLAHELGDLEKKEAIILDAEKSHLRSLTGARIFTVMLFWLGGFSFFIGNPLHFAQIIKAHADSPLVLWLQLALVTVLAFSAAQIKHNTYRHHGQIGKVISPMLMVIVVFGVLYDQFATGDAEDNKARMNNAQNLAYTTAATADPVKNLQLSPTSVSDEVRAAENLASLKTKKTQCQRPEGQRPSDCKRQSEYERLISAAEARVEAMKDYKADHAKNLGNVVKINGETINQRINEEDRKGHSSLIRGINEVISLLAGRPMNVMALAASLLFLFSAILVEFQHYGISTMLRTCKRELDTVRARMNKLHQDLSMYSVDDRASVLKALKNADKSVDNFSVPDSVKKAAGIATVAGATMLNTSPAAAGQAQDFMFLGTRTQKTQTENTNTSQNTSQNTNAKTQIAVDASAKTPASTPEKLSTGAQKQAAEKMSNESEADYFEPFMEAILSGEYRPVINANGAGNGAKDLVLHLANPDGMKGSTLTPSEASEVANNYLAIMAAQGMLEDACADGTPTTKLGRRPRYTLKG